MASESKPDAAKILATLQRGEIPPEIGPDWTGLKRVTSRAWLNFSVVMIAVLAVTLLALGLLNLSRWGSVDVLLFNCVAFLFFAVPWAISLLVNYRQRRSVQADLAAGQVQQAEGEILWHGSNYRLQFVGQQRWSSYLNNYSGVRPGPYRFYFLPRSGVVLLIEPLPGGNQTDILSNPLWQALGFQRDDLDYNRKGQMSPRQRRVVMAQSLGRLVLALALSALLVAIVAINWPRVSAGPAAGRIILGLIIIDAPSCAAVVYLCRRAYFLARDAASGRVQPQVGVAQLHSSVGYLRRLRLDVQGKRLIVTEPVWNALVNKQEYDFYLAPLSGRVLAIEPVQPPQSKPES